jgi:hypothetical protein
MYDSDEYPDTECEWDPEGQSTEPRAGHSASHIPYLNQGGTQQMTRPASRDSTTTIEDQSFNDFVVLRDVGSFHIARPQRMLTCTHATREDTVRLKAQAKALVSKYAESSDIQAQLLTRLERMVYTEQRKALSEDHTAAAPIVHCAIKLRDFLVKVKEERIDTGEHSSVVEHEIEWVKWLVEASRTGVMHIRTGECACQPDWGED